MSWAPGSPSSFWAQGYLGELCVGGGGRTLGHCANPTKGYLLRKGFGGDAGGRAALSLSVHKESVLSNVFKAIRMPLQASEEQP